MTKDQVREWLLTQYLRRTPETEAEVECILAQDDWKFVDARAEKFAGQAFEPGPQAVSEATGFALSALYECHDGPHLPTCPSAR